jgi:ribosome maturation factor RimP
VGESPLFVGVDICRNDAGSVGSKIEEIVQRVAESEGMERIEVELKDGGNQRLVRISIDKPSGITHADCELVSQQVGTILDVEDVVPGGRYTGKSAPPALSGSY